MTDPYRPPQAKRRNEKQLLTPDQVNRARELCAAGASRDEMARALGVTVDVMRARMIDQLADLPRRGRGGSWRAPTPDPTPDEITAACAELRRTWTPDRWFGPPREEDELRAAERFSHRRRPHGR